MKQWKILGLTTAACCGYYYFYQHNTVQTYQIQDINSDYFMLINTNNYSHKFPTFISAIKNTLDENLHFVPKEIDYKKPNFWKNQYAIRQIKFNDKLKLHNSNHIIQSALYTIIDSHFGAFSAQMFERNPVATAHIKYTSFEEIKPYKKYWILAYANKLVGNNIFVEGIVINEQFKPVMKLESRFVKINWKNSFKITQKKQN